MQSKKQKEIFLKEEGNKWYDRNKSSLSIKKSDPVIELLENDKLNIENVLEIGCSDGWRLMDIERLNNIECYGIDPSEKAIREGLEKSDRINLKQGTADKIPFGNRKFDLIIFGFCLYLCDREDLFKIAYEADNHLKDGGYIIIYDFEPPIPYKNNYHHKEGIFSYKMDYSKLFTMNPIYSLMKKTVFSHSGKNELESPDDRVSIQLMKKNIASAYITNPYK